ncbi:hypothetical protein LBMAG56_11050 [Verrucomicrobiota bacterium]|nr:hypothetical protein LBMAG56_11050 [Verrucomicrobiota bacterium]
MIEIGSEDFFTNLPPGASPISALPRRMRDQNRPGTPRPSDVTRCDRGTLAGLRATSSAPNPPLTFNPVNPTFPHNLPSQIIMKTISCFIVLVALTLTANAQVNGTLLKNKAKTTRANNNGTPPPAPAVAARPGAPAPAAPSGPTYIVPTAPLATVQSQSIKRLEADIATMKSKTEVTAEQKQKLTTDLLAAAAGAKPSEEAIRKLADSLGAAIANQKITSQDQAKLARDLHAAVNSATTPAEQTGAIIKDAKEILIVSGTARPAAQAVGADLQAIIAELQKNAPTATAAPAK